MRKHPIIVMLIIVLCASSVWAQDYDDDALLAEAGDRMRQATAFFRERVAVKGGYLWRYSADLARREGDGKVPRPAPLMAPVIMSISRMPGPPLGPS